MKKFLFKSLIAMVIASVFVTTWSFLMPNKKIAPGVQYTSAKNTEAESYKKELQSQYDKRIDAKVSEELSGINASIQSNLLMISEAISVYGCNSEQVKKLVEVKQAQDELNKVKVAEIIEKYGWLGADRIGAQNNYTLYTVIQNADFVTQEKYLPLMEQAVRSGSLAPEHFASLVDRKAMVQHKKQIYGTQFCNDPTTGKRIFAPIIDAENVSKRRSEIGLASIHFYAQQNNINYSFAKGNS